MYKVCCCCFIHISLCVYSVYQCAIRFVLQIPAQIASLTHFSWCVCFEAIRKQKAAHENIAFRQIGNAVQTKTQTDKFWIFISFGMNFSRAAMYSLRYCLSFLFNVCLCLFASMYIESGCRQCYFYYDALHCLVFVCSKQQCSRQTPPFPCSRI